MDVCVSTFIHHCEVDHFADNGGEFVVFIGKDAVEEAAVCARVIQGDVENIDGRVLDVVAPLAPVPIQTVHEVFVFDRGAHLTVGVDLMTR